MERFNFLEPPFTTDPTDPPGYKAESAPIGPAIGASMLAGRVYRVAPGEAVCPYHYEVGDEEWLLVLSGSALVRTPDGETTVGTGEVVCFPPGPQGAHRIAAGEDEVRVLMLSTRVLPAVCVYPDSDKIGVFSQYDQLLFPRSAAVDYYHGEP